MVGPTIAIDAGGDIDAFAMVVVKQEDWKAPHPTGEFKVYDYDFIAMVENYWPSSMAKVFLTSTPREEDSYFYNMYKDGNFKDD